MNHQTEEVFHHIAEARKGDQHAFRKLLDMFWSDLYGFLMKRTQNENDAEDLCLHTFTKAFDKIDSFDPQYTFGTWLTTIAKNLHIDSTRKNKRMPLADTDTQDDAAIDVPDDNLGPEDQLIKTQNLETLLIQIKQLKPHYREVIRLRYFQELSLKEISEELEISLSNVKVKLLRAKKLLLDIITRP